MLFQAVNSVGEEVFLIFDEYDSFANRLLLQVDTTSSDLGMEHYKATVSDKESFLRSFGNVLKEASGSGAIGRMFFTGVAPSDGLSSLNMVKDISMDERFEHVYGFTEKEIKSALENIFSSTATDDINHHFVIMKANFDGYRFNENQTDGIFNFQMALYYLKSLLQRGDPPKQLLDPNIAIPGDNVARFLIENYRGLDSLGALDFVFGYAGLKSKVMDVVFRSADLFDESTVDEALRSLAYYHGYLTFGDPSKEKLKGLLVCPNLVFNNIFIQSIRSQYVKALLKKPKAWVVELRERMQKASKEKLEELKDAALARAFDEVLSQLPKIL